MSLRARLTVGTAAMLALAIAAGFFAAYVVVRGELQGEIDTSLRERATACARFPLAPSTLPAPVGANLGGAAGYVQFVSASGKTTRSSGEHVRLPAAGARAVAAARGRRTSARRRWPVRMSASTRGAPARGPPSRSRAR